MTKLTLAYWCVLVAALMPFVCAGISKWGRDSQYNNKRPREWERTLQGYRARANAAQANCWEALPFFAFAVVIAHQAQATQSSINALAIAFIVIRVIYIALYLANQHMARSLVWLAGISINIWIFLLAA
jgi:uncharacterized MAPEG superfamily protein